jgi:hypothetical protein
MIEYYITLNKQLSTGKFISKCNHKFQQKKKKCNDTSDRTDQTRIDGEQHRLNEQDDNRMYYVYCSTGSLKLFYISLSQLTKKE